MITYFLSIAGDSEERIISHSYAGITRIRFNGYDLSPFCKGTPDVSAKLRVKSSKWGSSFKFKILNFELKTFLY